MSKGLTKAIGISNFTITKTENLLKTAKTIPAVNQGGGVEGDGTLDLYLSPPPPPHSLFPPPLLLLLFSVECHPYFQQQKLKEYCASKGNLRLTHASYLATILVSQELLSRPTVHWATLAAPQ